MVKQRKIGNNACKLLELLIELFQIPLKQNIIKDPLGLIHEKCNKNS